MANVTGGPGLDQARRLVTPIPGPRSRALAKRHRAAVLSGLVPVMPVFAQVAGGGIVVDVDGNHLIDFGSGIAVTGVGNAAPEVVTAVKTQVEAMTHTCYMITPDEGYVAVAERLAANFPRAASDRKSSESIRSMLVNSGSEAIENAIKIARYATGRPAVVALRHGFHGRTNLALAMTGRADPYRSGFGPFTPEVYRLPGSYPFRDGLTGSEVASRLFEQIEDQIGSGNLAAVVAEPIQGEGGFIVPATGFWPALANWCQSHDVVLVADEVQTGMARTGLLWAVEYEDVAPDLLVSAKALAGGLPLAAVTGRAELMNAPPPGALGGTYGGNPAATAACLAVFDLIERDNLAARALEIGEILQRRLTDLAAQDQRIGEVRGRGAMMAIEIVDPSTGEPDSAVTAAIANYAREHAVITLTCGVWRNVIRFLPPLVISDQLLHDGLNVIAEALAAQP